MIAGKQTSWSPSGREYCETLRKYEIVINRFNHWYVGEFECSARFVNFVLGSVIMESTRPEAGTKGAGDI